MTALARTPDAVLRCAAHALRNGEITWGRHWFIDPDTSCRCALGALAYAADPDDVDSDPQHAGTPAWAAMYALADYLVTELGAARCTDEDDDMPVLDPVETVGGWNDDDDRTVADVIAALEGAAQHLTVTAVAS